MKSEPLEIARLRREVIKLKAERDILKTAAGRCPPVHGRNGQCYPRGLRVAAVSLVEAQSP